MSTINTIQSTTLNVELKIKEMQETYNVLEEHRIQVSNFDGRFCSFSMMPFALDAKLIFLIFISNLFYFHNIKRRRLKVSLRRYADGISLGKTMEEVVRLGALSLKNVALDKSEVLSNDGERY